MFYLSLEIRFFILWGKGEYTKLNESISLSLSEFEFFH